MEKSKRNSSNDRLSKLPESLIFEIFWFLPLSDVVKTTILSKQWRNLWTTSPYLNFTDSLYRNFLYRALVLWRGDKLLKLKVVEVKRELSIPLARDVDVWVRFAKERHVEELYIDLRYPNYYYDDEENPVFANFGSLYMCPSLRVLSIKGCPFLNEGMDVKWDRLERLSIDGACLDEAGIARVLRGSPKLEEFSLTLPENGEDLCIQSTSLRKLSIEKNLEEYFSEEYPFTDTELIIRTPHLETLRLSGVPYSKFSMKGSSLTDVALGFCDQVVFGSRISQLMDLEGSLNLIIPAIQDVQSVTLSNLCIQMLVDLNNKNLLSPFSKVKFLKFDASSFSRHEEMASLLQMFPKLKRLVIEDKSKSNFNYYSDSDDDDNDNDDREPLEFEANLCNLLHLRTVEVTWGKSSKLIFDFIELLLKYANKLERMVFRVEGGVSPSCPSRSSFWASRKLLRMARSSPTAKLILCK